MILTEYSDNVVLLVAGLARAAQLKQAGLEVRMLFEGSSVLCFLGDRGKLSDMGAYDSWKPLLLKVKDLKIPYIVSSESAKNYIIYDELKAAGEPLSKDPDNMVDISDFIKQGYRIIVY